MNDGLNVGPQCVERNTWTSSSPDTAYATGIDLIFDDAVTDLSTALQELGFSQNAAEEVSLQIRAELETQLKAYARKGKISPQLQLLGITVNVEVMRRSLDTTFSINRMLRAVDSDQRAFVYSSISHSSGEHKTEVQLGKLIREEVTDQYEAYYFESMENGERNSGYTVDNSPSGRSIHVACAENEDSFDGFATRVTYHSAWSKREMFGAPAVPPSYDEVRETETSYIMAHELSHPSVDRHIESLGLPITAFRDLPQVSWLWRRHTEVMVNFAKFERFSDVSQRSEYQIKRGLFQAFLIGLEARSAEYSSPDDLPLFLAIASGLVVSEDGMSIDLDLAAIDCTLAKYERWFSERAGQFQRRLSTIAHETIPNFENQYQTLTTKYKRNGYQTRAAQQLAWEEIIRNNSDNQEFTTRVIDAHSELLIDGRDELLQEGCRSTYQGPWSIPAYAAHLQGLLSSRNTTTVRSQASGATLYSAPWCGICGELKGFFERSGIEYTEVNVDVDGDGDFDPGSPDFVRDGVPVTSAGGEIITGYNSIRTARLLGQDVDFAAEPEKGRFYAFVGAFSELRTSARSGKVPSETLTDARIGYDAFCEGKQPSDEKIAAQREERCPEAKRLIEGYESKPAKSATKAVDPTVPNSEIGDEEVAVIIYSILPTSQRNTPLTWLTGTLANNGISFRVISVDELNYEGSRSSLVSQIGETYVEGYNPIRIARLAGFETADTLHFSEASVYLRPHAAQATFGQLRQEIKAGNITKGSIIDARQGMQIFCGYNTDVSGFADWQAEECPDGRALLDQLPK